MARCVASASARAGLEPRDAVSDARKPGAADPYTRERLTEMLQFFELMNGWAEQMGKLPTPAVTRMVKMGDKIGKLLGS